MAQFPGGWTRVAAWDVNLWKVLFCVALPCEQSQQGDSHQARYSSKNVITSSDSKSDVKQVSSCAYGVKPAL